MSDRDLPIRGTDEWRPWHLPRLSGDPWRGPDLPQRRPVFRPTEPVLRPLRVGLAYHVFQSFARNDDLRLLHNLLRQSPIHVFVIPVGSTSTPRGFDRTTYIGHAIDAVENWAQYAICPVGDREQWVVCSAAGGEPIEARLDVDDPPFRLRAGLPIGGPIALPIAEDTLAGAAFQTLVAKALRCDVYVTDVPAMIDLDGKSGYKYPTEAVSPRAAVPLLGLYLRRLGRFRLEQDHRIGRRSPHPAFFSRGDEAITFFHTAVRSMLWATFEWELLSHKAATPEGEQEFKLFADTMLHRLEQVLRERDHVLHMLAVAPNGIAAGFAAGDALDTILLLSLAALDAIAEAIDKVFGLGANNPGWNNGDFLRRLGRKAEALARLFQEEQGGDSYWLLKTLSELRNSIHSEAISRSPKIPVVHEFAGRVLLPIPPARFAKIREHVVAMGGLEQWGVFEAVHGSERAHLHPGEFVEALTPRLFALVHRIMSEALRTVDDPSTRSRGGRYGQPLSEGEQDTLRLLGLERVDYDVG